jgi:hypothetical protein
MRFVAAGAATPSPDWDNEPANFFNDFGGCSNKTDDCYRSETYAAPLHGGEMTEYRSVGFDVDRNAHSVSVYIVVAADLRDNPIHEVTLTPGNAQCGSVRRSNIEGDIFYTLLDELSAALWQDHTAITHQLAFCGFDLPSGIAGASVKLATLRMHQREAFGSPFPAVVDHVEQDDVSSGRTRSQFRVRLVRRSRIPRSPSPGSHRTSPSWCWSGAGTDAAQPAAPAWGGGCGPARRRPAATPRAGTCAP